MAAHARRTLRLLSVIALTFGLILSSNCGGAGHPDLNLTPLLTPPGVEVASRDGFTLRQVAAPNGVFSGASSFELEVEQVGDATQVTVLATDAADLRVALLELEYPRRLAPVEGASKRWPGADETLSMLVLDQPDAVHFAAAVARPQDNPGASGNFELLRVSFNRPARGPSAPPNREASIIPDLTYDPVSGETSFSYYSQGDYDQNSEVNAADLVPLASNYLETGPFDPASALAVIDGDGNGEINAADIAPIAANFRLRTTGYRLYAGDAADYPGIDPGADNGGAELVDEVLFDELTAGDGERKRWISGDPTFPAREMAWLRSYDGALEGIASNSILLDLGDTFPPVWTDTDNPGVLAVAPHDGSATVYWGEATDEHTGPVTYTVYYNEGSEIDFDTAQTIELPADDPFDSYQFTEVTGLSNDTEYVFAVRASDSADPANEDANTVALTGTPTVPTPMPGLIDSDQVFPGSMVIPPATTTQITGSPQLTVQGDLHIFGTLLGNADICLIVEGDLFVDGAIQVAGSPDPVPDDSEWNNIKIVALGNFFFGASSFVGGDANIYIVDDEADLLSTEDVYDDTLEDTNPELYPFNFMPEEDEGATSSIRVEPGPVAAHTASSSFFGPFPCRGFVRGNWGKVPTPPVGVRRIVLNIVTRNGKLNFSNWSIIGPTGHKGADDDNCTAVGADAPVDVKNGNWGAAVMRIHASGPLTFNDVTIGLSDGGDGGRGRALDCCPAVATGGKGAPAHNKFRFTSGTSISVFGTMTLNPGTGGVGGAATATGSDGISGCPCEEGCVATATGGVGGSSRFGVRVRGNVNGIADVVLGVARGGEGGEAFARGGSGGDSTCCPGGAGCDGGTGMATGGAGGEATFLDAPPAMGGGGAFGGDGGGATAVGGNGGDGASCSKFEPGGDGGRGGDATAVGGPGGESTGPFTLDGMRGAALATGGNGGFGGDGCLAGDGGPVGVPDATVPGSVIDGVPGFPGQTHCPLFLCIPLPSLVPDPVNPGPIPDGFSGMAPLVGMDDGLTYGEIPFTWFNPGLGQLFWAANNDPPVICFINEAELNESIGVQFDLDGILWDGEPLPIVGSQLGVNYAENPVSPTGDIGQQSTIDLELQQLELRSIDPVPLSGGTMPQDFFVDSFFDVHYTVEAAPQAICFVEWFYLIDP